MKLVLGVDAGTHGIRILAADIDSGRVVFHGENVYERTLAAGGISELNPEVLWRSFLRTVASMEMQLSHKDEILALAITHQRGTVIPCDYEGSPLSNFICDSDSRASISLMLEDLKYTEESYYRKSGCPYISFNSLCKILGFNEKSQPRVGRVSTWLSPQDFLLSRLSGQILISEGSLLRDGCYDIVARKPLSPFFEIVKGEFGHERLLRFEDTSVSVSAQDGIPKCLYRAALIAVPGDMPAGLIGVTALKEGEYAINLGTTFVVSMLSKLPILDPEMMVTNEILPQGYYAPEYGTGAGGQYLDWLASLFWESIPSKDAFKFMDKMVSDTTKGSDGLITDSVLWQNLHGDGTGKIRGLTARMERRHFVRSAYESLAYEAKISLEKIQALSGVKGRLIKAFGGLSASAEFVQILASVTKLPIQSPEEKQASAFGAAIGARCALIGKKFISRESDSLEETERFVLPDEGTVMFYEERYREYVGQK